MRKLILAIGVAAVTLAFQGVNAAGLPYEKTEFDRTLPNIPERVATPRAFGAPYEELDLERALPQIPERVTAGPRMRGAPYEKTLFDRSLPEVAGHAELDGGAGAGATMPEGSLWDRDHNFVAPAK